jgi:hypothetical protein
MKQLVVTAVLSGCAVMQGGSGGGGGKADGEPSDVETAIDALGPGALVSVDQAAAILALPDVTDHLDVVRAFYVASPTAWFDPKFVEPWLGTTPRRFALLRSDADQLIEEFLTHHGDDASKLLLAKLEAVPEQLPTPDPSGQTNAQYWTVTNSGGALFPAHANHGPQGDWIARYSPQRLEIQDFTAYGIDLLVQGPSLPVGQLLGIGEPGDAGQVYVSIASRGFSSSAGFSKVMIVELDADATTGHVNRAVIAWDREETSTEYGILPGYLVYNATDPAGSYTYAPYDVGAGTSATYGPFYAAAGTAFTASTSGGDADVSVLFGAQLNSATAACTGSDPGSADSCTATAPDGSPVAWAKVSGRSAGTVTLTIDWTPAPR